MSVALTLPALRRSRLVCTSSLNATNLEPMSEHILSSSDARSRSALRCLSSSDADSGLGRNLKALMQLMGSATKPMAT